MPRIDKYVWSVRLFKTRSQASSACKAGRVLLNDQPAKPAKEIKAGDIITLKRPPLEFRYKVLEPIQNRVGAKLVSQFMEDITREEVKQQNQELREAQKLNRPKGLGRPTKRERRKLDNFKRGKSK